MRIAYLITSAYLFACTGGKLNVSLNEDRVSTTDPKQICTEAGQSSCYLDTDMKAIKVEKDDTANLSPELLIEKIAKGEEFYFWDSDGVRHRFSGKSGLTIENVREGVAVGNLSGKFRGAPEQASNLTITEPVKSLYTLSWEVPDNQVSSLAVASVSGTPNFSPENGLQYSSGTEFGSSVVLYSGKDTSFQLPETLNSNSSYRINIYLYSSSLQYSKGVSVDFKASPCSNLNGGEWLLVNGNGVYSTSDFCVMKYEAYMSNGTARSQAGHLGASYIKQSEAKEACAALGENYSLIKNSQWLTLTSEIMFNSQNWTGGAIGSGTIARGHSDDEPSGPCPPSDDDRKAWVESSCTQVLSGQGEDDEETQQRTHVLENGEVIWDLGANLYEWIDYYEPTGKPLPNSDLWQHYADLSSGTTTTIETLRPTNFLFADWDDSWSVSQGIGKVIVGMENVGGAMVRGARWNKNADAGLFATVLNLEPEMPNIGVGFRCVYSYSITE